MFVLFACNYIDFENLMDKVDKLLELQLSNNDSSISLSKTELVDHFLKFLDSDKDIIFSGSIGDPILDSMLNSNSFRDEHDFIKFMTPTLRDLCSPQLIFVNSEEYAWLESNKITNNIQKPDGFYAPLWVFSKKTLTEAPFISRGQQANLDSWYFGVPASTCLFDSLHIVDCKVTLSKRGYGEHLEHLQRLSGKCKGPAYGMYFGVEGFSLSICAERFLVERIYAKWTDKGSKDLVRDFFCNHKCGWYGVLNLASELGVQIVDPLKFASADTAFLGAGGTGRVIRVVKDDKLFGNSRIRDVIALKVAQAESGHLLESEFNFMKKHRDSCECNLLAIPIGDSITQSASLCGYLMKTVGESHVSRNVAMKTTQNLNLVISALYSLHIHNPVIIHGDARINNLIVCGTNYIWIDFMVSESSIHDCVEISKANDMATLISSILGHGKCSSVMLLVVEYSKNTNLDAINALVDEVWRVGNTEM
jgi:hypothetical protein